MKRSLIKDLTKPAEGARPVYFFGGLASHVLTYRPLARVIDDRWWLRGVLYPVYAGGDPNVASIEALASSMRTALDDAEDPIVLSGFSVGGTIAYQIAVHLTAQGRRAGVVMIDSQPAELRKLWLQRRHPKVRRAIRLFRKARNFLQKARQKQEDHDPKALPEFTWTPEDPQVRIFQRENREAARIYLPPRSNVPVVMLKAVPPRIPRWIARICWPVRDNGWGLVAPVLGVLPVSAGHHTIMARENHPDVAAALNKGFQMICDRLEGGDKPAQ